jgi:pimeloyl-ACP methyl ester carboxylesterase
MKNPGFLFVHGAWHGEATWRRLLPMLRHAGFDARALDLPGAGRHARIPTSFTAQPFDAAAFATEPSPNACVTQAERTEAVVSLVEEMGGNVILVGHSLGGVTISAVAEAVPARLRAVVYLTAFMLPPLMPAIAMIQHEIMAAALVPPLFCADPGVIGALRINPAAEDAGYVSQLRGAFYGDVSDADFVEIRASLHCDEPAAVAVTPSPVTAARFGTIKRHYIRCLADRAIPVTGQDFMIGAVDLALRGVTEIHTLDASHSPFFSKPADLVDILKMIAV